MALPLDENPHNAPPAHTASEAVVGPIPADLSLHDLHALLAEVGLTHDEYRQFVSQLGRQPNMVELGMAGAMWSEHCGYKHSKPLLRLFPTKGERVLQGPGENAGVVDIGDGWAVALKIESHNHPSAVEPVEGAATGVGGIVRDIFTMGGRPIALLNSLRFGPLTNPHTRYLFGGVVAGIGGYGNCIGVPTVGGEIYFDPSYAANPLVNAMCVGLLRKERLMRAVASGLGNPVLLVGADTGRDGIHGATFASDTLGEDSLQDRPAVQVGNPFLEKCLMEACLEVLEIEGLVVGMQDLGAAGLTSSSVECAARAESGIEIDLAHVPRRERGMNAYEIMLSESQERMLVIVTSGREEEAREVFTRWGLHSNVIGRVTGDGMVRVYDGPLLAAELPAHLLADEVPIRYVTGRPDPLMDELQHPDWDALLPHEDEQTRYDRAVLDVLASPNVASKERVFRTYDHTIGSNTVLQPGEADAAVVRIKGTNKAIALTTDCNSRYCYLDPYAGGAHAVAEAARNLSCVGAEPLAVTDCLNFGNPENPHVFYQMEGAVNGIADACNALGIPVVSGNVSLYNDTNGVAVLPTPVIGMVGLLEDAGATVGMGLREGLIIGLLGSTPTGEHYGTGAPLLGASQYVETCLGQKVGTPPRVDMDMEKRVQEACRAGIQAGLIQAAHDPSEGGLGTALAEMCIAGGVGARVILNELMYPHHRRPLTATERFSSILRLGLMAFLPLEEQTRIFEGLAEALEHQAMSTIRADLETATAESGYPVETEGLTAALSRGGDFLSNSDEYLSPRTRSDVILFSEEPSRILVGLTVEKWPELQALARSYGVDLFLLGLSGGDQLIVTRGDNQIVVDLPLPEVDNAWRNGLG
ncbi:MAG TPA: phosphoribosylformylglycinamidine synthase subunit PurL [Chloroflexia bacterium]